MSPKLKSAALVGIGMLIATAGFWLWQHFLSHDAQIDSLHRACRAEFAEAAARLKAGVEPGDGTPTMLRGLSESLSKLIGGSAEGMGDAVCDAVRDACRSDFDGRICTAARERYR